MTARVTHVLSSFGIGGQERVAFDLAVAQLRAGWSVSALSLAPPPDGPLAAELRAAGVEVDRVARPRPGVDPTLVVRIARWLARRGVELVHTHNRMALIYGAPAARLSRARVVHTKHGNNPRGGTRLLAGNLAGRLVHAFVAVSQETAEFARRRKEIDERRLLVIPNGIELARFHPDPASRGRVRRELGIPADAWVIGTVGRIAAEKDHALLLRAVAPLLGPETPLVIAGDGQLLPELVRLAATLGVAGAVHFLGARGDVPDVLNAFDTFVLSSVTEGLPLVVPEAMASGLPVVATRVGGLPGVIDDGQTGYLVQPGDARGLRERVALLRSDRAASRAMGERARGIAVTRFSADRMQREYLSLYMRVLGRAMVM